MQPHARPSQGSAFALGVHSFQPHRAALITIVLVNHNHQEVLQYYLSVISNSNSHE